MASKDKVHHSMEQVLVRVEWVHHSMASMDRVHHSMVSMVRVHHNMVRAVWVHHSMDKALVRVERDLHNMVRALVSMDRVDKDLHNMDRIPVSMEWALHNMVRIPDSMEWDKVLSTVRVPDNMVWEKDQDPIKTRVTGMASRDMVSKVHRDMASMVRVPTMADKVSTADIIREWEDTTRVTTDRVPVMDQDPMEWNAAVIIMAREDSMDHREINMDKALRADKVAMAVDMKEATTRNQEVMVTRVDAVLTDSKVMVMEWVRMVRANMDRTTAHHKAVVEVMANAAVVQVVEEIMEAAVIMITEVKTMVPQDTAAAAAA